MTQCLEEDEGESCGAALQVEEELDANWEDYYSSGSHSDSDSEIDDETVKHAHGNGSESSNRSLVLKVPIQLVDFCIWGASNQYRKLETWSYHSRHLELMCTGMYNPKGNIRRMVRGWKLQVGGRGSRFIQS